MLRERDDRRPRSRGVMIPPCTARWGGGLYTLAKGGTTGRRAHTPPAPRGLCQDLRSGTPRMVVPTPLQEKKGGLYRSSPSKQSNRHLLSPSLFRAGNRAPQAPGTEPTPPTRHPRTGGAKQPPCHPRNSPPPHRRDRRTTACESKGGLERSSAGHPPCLPQISLLLIRPPPRTEKKRERERGRCRRKTHTFD